MTKLQIAELSNDFRGGSAARLGLVIREAGVAQLEAWRCLAQGREQAALETWFTDNEISN